MINAGFTLHLYCCCSECQTKSYGSKFAEFADRYERACWRAARDKGWRVDRKTNRAWAPDHKKSPNDVSA